jgi:hypothetical protein
MVYDLQKLNLATWILVGKAFTGFIAAIVGTGTCVFAYLSWRINKQADLRKRELDALQKQSLELQIQQQRLTLFELNRRVIVPSLADVAEVFKPEDDPRKRLLMHSSGGKIGVLLMIFVALTSAANSFWRGSLQFAALIAALATLSFSYSLVRRYFVELKEMALRLHIPPLRGSKAAKAN